MSDTPHPDTIRLNALEEFVEKHGAILLHMNKQGTGFLGLGLLLGGHRRSLRSAIDDSLTPGLLPRRRRAAPLTPSPDTP
jgi:hypothetical protein